MIEPRAADDFAMIRARMKELRRERERAEAAESDLPSDPPTCRARIGYVAARGRTAPEQIRRSGSTRIG
jgi:hypothetical protein